MDKVVKKSTQVKVLLLTQKWRSSRCMAKHFYLSKNRKVVKINSTQVMEVESNFGFYEFAYYSKVCCCNAYNQCSSKATVFIKSNFIVHPHYRDCNDKLTDFSFASCWNTFSIGRVAK